MIEPKRVSITNKSEPECLFQPSAAGSGPLLEQRRVKVGPTHPQYMAKPTRRELSEEPINIRREPLRTSNKPDSRRRVVQRRDDISTKGAQMQVSNDELMKMTADEDGDNDTPRRLSDDDEGASTTNLGHQQSAPKVRMVIQDVSSMKFRLHHCTLQGL